ncbi:aromatic prenyltransferase, partial [Mycena rebaudengoi]
MSLCDLFFLERVSLWLSETGEIFSGLLKMAEYDEEHYRLYKALFYACIVPQLGLSRREAGARSSYMGDDGTPIEFSWVVDRTGTATIRFTMEPMSPVDGSPTAWATWMSCLSSVGKMWAGKDFDLQWSEICHRTLVQEDIREVQNMPHISQFSIGGDFNRGGFVAKSYFLPHLRSHLTGIAPTEIVTASMLALGLEASWDIVKAFIKTLPGECLANPEIVSVDCLHPSKSRAKVYLRTQETSLEGISNLMTLGGRLCDPVVAETVATLAHLWRLLFPSVDDTSPLPSRNPTHYANGFVVYFEMALGKPFPLPKVYIPVRHYCDNDEVISKAVSQYYIDIGEVSTVVDSLKRLFTHRSLAERTGIYTYIGCAARRERSQVSLYLSPEAYAPERF